VISLTEDDFVKDHAEHNARWVVGLSDGSNAYYDDHRPNLEIHSSWQRLKDYCNQNNIYITSMYLQFRSHFENIEGGKDGYFFSKAVRGVLKQEEEKTYHFFLCGYIDNDKVKIYKYSVPELIVIDTFYREIEECEENLIWARKE
jgi:hypothetical protein